MNWDLKEIFIDENEASDFSKKLEKSCIKFENKYKNNLENLSKKDFLKAITKYEDLNVKIGKIGTWAYLNFALDSRLGSLLAKFEKIIQNLEEHLLFFTLEFNNISQKKQDKFIAYMPKQSYEYFLTLTKKQKKFQLSFKEERILLKTSNVGANAFSRLFDENFAKMKFGKDEKGLEEILSTLSDKDREKRKNSALILSKGLEQNSHLLTYIYNMIRADLQNDIELRNYKNPEEFRHINNQISQKSVDALIKASENNFDIAHKYYAKKKEILGLDELYDYDRYAPLDDDLTFNFNEAKDLTLKAFRDFDLDFAKIAKYGLENSWCDAMPRDFKQGGAFSHSGVDGVHPYVLLNFTNKRRDVYTLAHEFGHAIHQFLAYKSGALGSDTPLTTAETASVFCEMLVFEKMKNEAKSKEERLAIIANKLEDIFATLFRQINFTTFERRIHANKAELSNEEISQIWMEESQKMFGKSLILNDYYKSWWSYVPHFIHTPFYCYSYAYAQLLVLALFGLYKSGQCDNFQKIYKEFLSLGGSKSPKDMVAMFGFDIDDEEFWEIGLKEIRKLLNEFLSL